MTQCLKCSWERKIDWQSFGIGDVAYQCWHPRPNPSSRASCYFHIKRYISQLLQINYFTWCVSYKTLRGSQLALGENKQYPSGEWTHHGRGGCGEDLTGKKTHQKPVRREACIWFHARGNYVRFELLNGQNPNEYENICHHMLLNPGLHGHIGSSHPVSSVYC